MILVIALPAINPTVRTVMILVAAGFMVFSLIRYIPFFFTLRKTAGEKKKLSSLAVIDFRKYTPEQGGSISAQKGSFAQ